jgi:TetR/AcrR family transcriptional regulator
MSTPPALSNGPATAPPPLPPPRGPAPAEATRERLLQAAHELLYERGGANVSVSEICGRASANVAMVKYCFGNKDGLMLALITRITDSFRADFERLAAQPLGWREKLARHLREVVRNYMRYPYLTRLLLDQLREADEHGNRALSESLVIPMAAFHRELLGEAERAGAIQRRIDPLLFFFSVVGMCEFLFAAQPWLRYGFDTALDDDLVERYANHVSELVLAGIEAGPATPGDRPTHHSSAQSP